MKQFFHSTISALLTRANAMAPAAVIVVGLWGVAGVSGLSGNLAYSQTPQSDLPRMLLRAGMYQIDTQIALTPQQHEIGLMYRPSMPQYEGMLFIFPRPSQQCFWMKNTLLPLTAAFIADDGTIVNLEDMKPQTTDSHCSDKPVRFVLEVNQGWFAKRGMKAGTRLTGEAFNR